MRIFVRDGNRYRDLGVARKDGLIEPDKGETASKQHILDAASAALEPAAAALACWRLGKLEAEASPSIVSGASATTEPPPSEAADATGGISAGSGQRTLIGFVRPSRLIICPCSR
jgi:hypothetical protein